MDDEKREDDSKGFKVRDRRGVDEPRDSKGVEQESKEEKSVDDQELPGNEGVEVNFASFVLSLSTSAMVHLGLMENPVSKSKGRSSPAYSIAWCIT